MGDRTKSAAGISGEQIKEVYENLGLQYSRVTVE